MLIVMMKHLKTSNLASAWNGPGTTIVASVKLLDIIASVALFDIVEMKPLDFQECIYYTYCTSHASNRQRAMHKERRMSVLCLLPITIKKILTQSVCDRQLYILFIQ